MMHVSKGLTHFYTFPLESRTRRPAPVKNAAYKNMASQNLAKLSFIKLVKIATQVYIIPNKNTSVIASKPVGTKYTERPFLKKR